ncbi:hypothetical protein KDA_39770 [Dictyobacter alpinus]|uniref:Uncharacterized protein n=1 Tax=Dictyobacter alpinus TaxID=2014873 RepID=A0A402BAS0_9CHLR|nr:hypothetical protein [Dictyobacter alpinus]GCE28493.1 hypothetical protein KDA_39770 [Dictyobacter alpinus]
MTGYQHFIARLLQLFEHEKEQHNIRIASTLLGHYRSEPAQTFLPAEKAHSIGLSRQPDA